MFLSIFKLHVWKAREHLWERMTNHKLFLWNMSYTLHSAFLRKWKFLQALSISSKTNKQTKSQNGLTRLLWLLPNSASIKLAIKKYKLQIPLLMNLRLCSGPVKIDFVYTDLVALWDCLVACLSSLSRWNYLLSCTKSCWGIAVPCLASIYLMLCYCLKMKSIYF